MTDAADSESHDGLDQLRREGIRRSVGYCFFLCLALQYPAKGQQPEPVQPLKSQSAEQKTADMNECGALATTSTGYDPAKDAATPAQPAPPVTGARVRGAAVGATAGAFGAEVRSENYDRLPDEVHDEYREDQARSGAAAGVVVGASRQRQERRGARRTQQAAQQSEATAADEWNRSYNACLQERGYTVSN